MTNIKMEISNNIVLSGIPNNLHFDITCTLTLKNQAYTDAVKFDRAVAARKQPVLILVHTKELLYQWQDRIKTFLNVDAGLVGAGIHKIVTNAPAKKSRLNSTNIFLKVNN